MWWRCLVHQQSNRWPVQVQTFMCVPLGDRGGIVEWVLNTRTYHAILKDTYASLNTPMQHISPSVARPAWDAAYKLAHNKLGGPPADPKALVRWFAGKCVEVPPVMHEWWLTTCALFCCNQYESQLVQTCHA